MRRRFDAVLFDLDGVLVDSEPWWNAVRIAFAADHGRAWTDDDHHAVMGANSRGWALIMRERLGLDDMDPDEIERAVVSGVVARYRAEPPPVIPARRRPCAASPPTCPSRSPRPPIPTSSRRRSTRSSLRDVLRAIVSSDEVTHGKPAPDVYRLAAERLGVDAARCLVVEDSINGVRAGKAAGAFVVLVPNASVPPAPGTEAMADLVIDRLADLDPERAGA